MPPPVDRRLQLQELLKTHLAAMPPEPKIAAAGETESLRLARLAAPTLSAFYGPREEEATSRIPYYVAAPPASMRLAALEEEAAIEEGPTAVRLAALDKAAARRFLAPAPAAPAEPARVMGATVPTQSGPLIVEAEQAGASYAARSREAEQKRLQRERDLATLKAKQIRERRIGAFLPREIPAAEAAALMQLAPGESLR
jgi:hypothetical protein